MLKLAGAVVGLTLISGVIANAQPAPPPGVASQASEPSARAVELSHRLFVAMHTDEQIRTMLRSLMPPMMDRLATKTPGFKLEWRQALTEATIAAMDDVMPAYLKNAEGIYARTFSEDDLVQSVAFYESPAGRSLLTKLPQLAPELAKDMMTRMSGLEADIRVRFCAKTDACKSAGANKPNGT